MMYYIEQFVRISIIGAKREYTNLQTFKTIHEEIAGINSYIH
ncbi:hypothetical protein [Weissella coleopterorum]|nr:hypothetical protein [Weissella coleopterorum]